MKGWIVGTLFLEDMYICSGRWSSLVEAPSAGPMELKVGIPGRRVDCCNCNVWWWLASWEGFRIPNNHNLPILWNDHQKKNFFFPKQKQLAVSLSAEDSRHLTGVAVLVYGNSVVTSLHQSSFGSSAGLDGSDIFGCAQYFRANESGTILHTILQHFCSLESFGSVSCTNNFSFMWVDLGLCQPPQVLTKPWEHVRPSFSRRPMVCQESLYKHFSPKRGSHLARQVRIPACPTLFTSHRSCIWTSHVSEKSYKLKDHQTPWPKAMTSHHQKVIFQLWKTRSVAIVVENHI